MINWQTISGYLGMSGLGLGLAFWPVRKHRTLSVLAPVLLGLVGLGYWYWGAWSAQSRFEQDTQRQRKAEAVLATLKSPTVLIQKLQAHLDAHPDSARGWYLLGRLYASQHVWEKAHQAFKRAYALDSKDDLIAVNYAQSLFAQDSAADAELARTILNNKLQNNPNHLDALMLLAIDAQQRHAVQDALMYLRRLLILVPDDSPEAERIRKAIQKLASPRIKD